MRPGRCWTSACGRCPQGSSGAGSTTSSPIRSCTSFRGRIRGMPLLSGMVAWGSGAPWPWGYWGRGSAASGRRCLWLRSWTPWHRVWFLPRHWAGGATGSTTSCTGTRRRCHGNSRSIRWTRPPAPQSRIHRVSRWSWAISSRHSSMNRCGAWLSGWRFCMWTGASSWGRGAYSRYTWPATQRDASPLN